MYDLSFSGAVESLKYPACVRHLTRKWRTKHLNTFVGLFQESGLVTRLKDSLQI